MTKRCLAISPLYGLFQPRISFRKSPVSSLDPFHSRCHQTAAAAAPLTQIGNDNLRQFHESCKIKHDSMTNIPSKASSTPPPPPPPPPSTISAAPSSSHHIENTPDQAPPDPPPEHPLPPSSPQTTVIQSPVLLRKAARAKLHEKLPRKTDFDPLRRNPWARALASPVRMCSATHARLPAELFGDYGLVEHPETKQPWMMPVDLLGDEIRGKSLGATAEAEGEADGGEIGERGEMLEGTEHAIRPTERHRQRFPVLRLTNNPALLSRIAKGKNAFVTRSLIPYRWKHPTGFLSKNENNNIVWREDLADFVLKNLRKNVVRGLKHCCVVGKDHRWTVLDINPQSTTADALHAALKKLGDLKNIKCGALLLLKSQSAENGPPEERGCSSTPPELVTLPIQTTQIPVFDLTRLLSEENLRELREHHAFFARDAVLFRPSGDKTVYTMLGLWKLHSYLTVGH